MTVTPMEGKRGSAINYVESCTEVPGDAQRATELCRRSLGRLPRSIVLGGSSWLGSIGSSGSEQREGTGTACRGSPSRWERRSEKMLTT